MIGSENEGFPYSANGKESVCHCRRGKRCMLDPWVGKILWRRKWQSTPVFLPWKSHGQRSLAGYSSWDQKESDMTEHAHTRHTSKSEFTYRYLNKVEKAMAPPLQYSCLENPMDGGAWIKSSCSQLLCYMTSKCYINKIYYL